MPHVRTSEIRGEPVNRQGVEVTPVGRSVRVTWRGGALEWRYPAAIEVRNGTGRRRVPIFNATRRAIMAIAVAGLITSMSAGWIVRIVTRRRSR